MKEPTLAAKILFGVPILVRFSQWSPVSSLLIRAFSSYLSIHACQSRCLLFGIWFAIAKGARLGWLAKGILQTNSFGRNKEVALCDGF